MAGLISDTLLDQLRSVAYRQLTSDVEIQRSTISGGAFGAEEVWTTVETTTGWLKSTNDPGTELSVGMRAAALSRYELRLRQGTDIQSGDRCLIGDGTYIVQETNAEVTISLFLKAGLRRLE